MKMVKRFPIFCVVVLVLSLLTPALAAGPEGRIIDLGDGYYIVETITQDSKTRAGDTVSGSKTNELYYRNTLIGSATLYAQFDISGSSAVATIAAINGSGYNGWSYSRGNTSLSGNVARGTAYFQGAGVEKYITVTLTCSANGTLS